MVLKKNGKSYEEIIREDIKTLHDLGYAQQLYREMGGFSNFAISFTIISILTGAILLYGYGLKFAGPIINTVGWPVVGVFTLCVAASMAEIASLYPTAGGLYYWAYRFGGKGWAWITAWMNMIGQITITAGINFAAANYLIGLFTQFFNIDPNSIVFLGLKYSDYYFTFLVMAALMIPQILINIFGIKLVEQMNNFSVWWHVAGVFIIALLLTFFGKHHNNLSFLFLFANTVNPLDAASAQLPSGATGPALIIGPLTIPSPLFSIIPGLVDLYKVAPFVLVFGLGLLQAQWTYTGYDASAHMAEETYLARMNSAWGVFLSVAVSTVTGYIMLMALTWSITDLAKTTTAPYPVLFIVHENLAPFFANLIALLIAGAMFLCGNGSITSMARMWFAFARDDGMPGSKVLSKVSLHWRTPVNAILVTSIIVLLLTVYSGAYYVISSISTITLYIAYAIPIYLNWRNKQRDQGEYTTPDKAPWSLKRWGSFINVVAMVWTLIITILFVLPPNELVLWTMIAISLLLAIYWFAVEGKRFTGPRRMNPEELVKIEKDYTS